MRQADTIAAIATAPGRSGIGVVRISGPDLGGMMYGIIGAPIPPRRAVLVSFRDGAGTAIDQGIALYFRAPHSYTGEDVLELQGHGGPVVLHMLLQRCLELGARVAEPGEFTRRAFLNDKLDLVQAEGVADLIEAATAQAARCAVRSLRGEFSYKIHILIDDLISLRALVEATLDFPEEELDFLEEAGAVARLEALRATLGAIRQASQQGSLLREGIHIVLAGQPNVGKSSLLNRLAGEEVAIVTEIPGTTRDAIRQAINIRGVPVHVVDTAGLRDSNDPIENLGMARSWSAMQSADLVLLIIDATQGESEQDRSILARLPASLRVLRIMNKVDLLDFPAGGISPDRDDQLWVSAKTGAGLDTLRERILEMAGWRNAAEEGLFLARARHLQALQQAQGHLEQALCHRGHPELLAEELRLAQEALEVMGGRYTADDLLGEIFSRFCIGK
jgi:tRNA modification GTPase